MAILNLYHLFAVAMVIIRCHRRRRLELIPREIENFGYNLFLIECEKEREQLFKFICMSLNNRFDHLLGLIAPVITKDNLMRATIPPEKRLVITLGFSASGETQQALSQYFQVGKLTVSNIQGVHLPVFFCIFLYFLYFSVFHACLYFFCI